MEEIKSNHIKCLGKTTKRKKKVGKIKNFKNDMQLMENNYKNGIC